MRLTIIATLTAASSALLFAACTTTPEEPQAGSDARQPSAMTPGAKPQPLGRNPIASVDTTTGEKRPASMPKDTDSMTSKRSIYYDLDGFDVRQEYRGIVEMHAKYLRENPGSKMLIEGNADERGSREYNVALGQRRSESVKKLLLLLGAKESQIESASLGEEKPVCTDHAEDCWWKNRRGDIRYTGQ
jgi:peptidoglycan-associated lipoprotein